LEEDTIFISFIEPTDIKTPAISWSAIVKTSPLKPTLSNLDRRSSLTPNTGHKHDFRTRSYDVERDKRVKLNKLKKTNSLLGTLDDAANSSNVKSLPKRLTHQSLTESKSLGPYDVNLSAAKPRLDIKRKSLVLKAKRSAGIKQDPTMDNWYLKDVPAKIELFSTLKQSSPEEELPPEVPKPAGKKKLTRTKGFSPSLKVTDFTEKIINKHDITDDYFSNDKYEKIIPKQNPATSEKTVKDVVFNNKIVPLSAKLSNPILQSVPMSYSAMLKRSSGSPQQPITVIICFFF